MCQMQTTPSRSTPPLDTLFAANRNGLADKIIKRRVGWMVSGGRGGFLWQDRDDLQQDMAEKVLECLPEFEGGDSTKLLKGFIRRVAWNRAMDILRDGGRRTYYPGLPPWNHHLANGEKVAATAIAGRATPPDDWSEEDDVRRSYATSATLEHEVDLRVDTQPVLDLLPERQRKLCEALKTKSLTDHCRATGQHTGTQQRQVVQMRERFVAAGLSR
jgi:DNA-directed RNA polymerase specialized sigma24 family protein